MQKYVERMVREHEELTSRIKKAEDAIKSEPYGMTSRGKELLLRQIVVMKEYASVLRERIEYEETKCAR